MRRRQTPDLRAAVFAVLAAALCPVPVPAGDPGIERAQQDFMINCQGCHQPDGRGTEGLVPDLRNSAGLFLGVPGGREYLVRVPGVANSTLDDTALAGVLNWMLRAFSSTQLPPDFVPYTANEVAALRKKPLNDPASNRAALLDEMARE